MKPFIFQHGTTPWPAELTLLHVYAIVDLESNPELGQLIKEVRAATQGAPLAHIGNDWFHITLYQHAAKPADQVTAAERHTLHAHLQQHLSHIAPFTVTVGPALTYPSGLLLDLHPDEPLNALRRAVEDSAAVALDAADNTYDTGVLHLTESYATAEVSLPQLHQIQRELRRVRPSHAPLHINRVDVVDVTANTQATTITWTSLATILLGSPGTPCLLYTSEAAI
ncbi:2'-5' RNA ligase family protein, partial [Nonomuraea turkmeniaca]